MFTSTRTDPPAIQDAPWPEHSLDGGSAAAAEYVAYARVAAAVALPELADGPAAVHSLDAGIMNYVYRVETATKTFFLKQALPRVKHHDRLGLDLAGVSPRRIHAEWRALSVLADALPPSHRAGVPRAAWYDRRNNVLWTEDVAPGARSLQQALQAGDCDPGGAGAVGGLLGAIHGAGGGHVEPLWPSEVEDSENWVRFLRMRTIGVLQRARLPAELEALTRAFYEQARRHERRGMVSHLDAAPKNVLLAPDGAAAVLDFELGAAVSDPAYDPGFLAGHYLLMGENLPAMRDAARVAVREMVSGYLATAPVVDARWDERLARYAGLTMVYRLCGSSPAPYLDPARFTAIREEGMQLLRAGRLP